MKKSLSVCFLFIFMACFSQASHAAPDSDLLKQWQASNDQNTTSINHSSWQELLDKYLVEHSSGVNRVDYAALKANDSQTLEDYLDDLQDIDPRNFKITEQFAYWVNLYNAATVALIIENFPVESITKIKDGLLSFGPWDREWLEVGEELLSLNDIEHRILRPIWQDNRIHYAVNCASISCPNLGSKAFTADNTEEMLDTLAIEYINHTRGVTFVKGKLTVSSIFDWYAEDFDTPEGGLISHLISYAKPELKTQLEALSSDSYKHDYDWRLNGIDTKITNR